MFASVDAWCELSSIYVAQVCRGAAAVSIGSRALRFFLFFFCVEGTTVVYLSVCLSV